MLSRLRSTLASLIFLEEEEALSRAHLLASLLPLAIALMVLLTALPLLAGSLPQRAEVGGAMILIWGGAGWLLRRGKLRPASLLFIAGTWVVASWAIITRGGVRAPAYAFYLVLTTYAAFLVTPAAALAVFGASLVVGLGVTVAAQTGVLSPPLVAHTPATLYATYSACMLMVVLVVLRVTVDYRDALGKLRTSEERYRSLVETTSDWIWEVDRNGAYTYASPKVRDLLGYDPAEVVGKTPFDLMPPAEAQRVAEVVRTAFENAQPFSHVENTNLHKDGHEVVLDTSGVPVFDDAEVLRGFRGIDRDVTEQKRAEAALQESEARYRQFMRLSAEGIWRLEAVPPIPADLEEREQAELILRRAQVAEGNDVIARRYGFSRPEEMVGASLDELWVDTRESKLAAALQFIRGGYRVTDLETSGRLADGTRGHFLDNLVGVVEGGFLIRAWGTERDVTQRRRAEEALRESEERFRAIIESTRDWIWFADVDGVHTYSNRTVQDMLGWAPEEIVGKPVFEFMHPEDVPLAAAQIARAIAARSGWSGLVIRWRHQDGTYRSLESAAAPAFGPTGDLLGWYGADRDVTESKEAEEALRESEEKYRALFAMLPVAAVIHQDRKVVLANPASVRMFRAPDADGFIGDEIARYIGEEARAQVEAHLRAGRRGGPEAPDYYLTTLRRADGEEFPAEVSVADVVYQGRPAAQAVIIDITERVRMQEALRDSEAHLRALFAAMSDIILVVNDEGRHLEIAPTKPGLLYHSVEDLLGKTVHEVLPAEQADYFVGSVRQALTAGHTMQIEYRLVLGGRERSFSAAISPLSPDAAMVVVRDITAMAEQQSRLLAAERARADLAQHLNEEVNHRARNNLAMVSGLLQMQALQEPNPELATRLREAVARMRSFVDIHEKIYAAGAEEANLLEVTRQVATTLRAVFSATAAEFSVEGDSGLFPTRAVTNLAVLTNELMTNALKHGGVGAGRAVVVKVRIDRAEGRLRISVWNSGPPVPDGFDAAAQKGMGLRLVTAFAEQYGGSFSLRPAEGGTMAELVVEEATLE